MSEHRVSAENAGIRVRCIAHPDSTGHFDTWEKVQAWVKAHAETVPHDPRWSITFVLGYMGREPSGADGVIYHEPALTTPPGTTAGADG